MPAREREPFTEGSYCIVGPTEKELGDPGTHETTEEPAGRRLPLGRTDKIGVGEHLMDPTRCQSGAQARERRSKRGRSVGRRYVEVSILSSCSESLGLLGLPQEHLSPGGCQGELGIGRDLRVGAFDQPELKSLELASVHELVRRGKSDPPCEFEVAAFVCAAEGLGRVAAVLFVPLGGSGQVFGGELGIGPVELGAEKLGKQGVVPVPAVVVVEGDHERVRAFQLLEHLARVVDLQDRRRTTAPSSAAGPMSRAGSAGAPAARGRASPRRGSRRSRVGRR